MSKLEKKVTTYLIQKAFETLDKIEYSSDGFVKCWPAENDYKLAVESLKAATNFKVSVPKPSKTSAKVIDHVTDFVENVIEALNLTFAVTAEGDCQRFVFKFSKKTHQQKLLDALKRNLGGYSCNVDDEEVWRFIWTGIKTPALDKRTGQPSKLTLVAEHGKAAKIIIEPITN